MSVESAPAAEGAVKALLGAAKEVKYNPQAAQYDWTEYTPGEGNFFVKFYNEPEKTAGGIYRPDTSKRREIVGEVLDVGKAIRVDGQIKELPVGVGGFVMANPDYGTMIAEGEESFGDNLKVSFQVRIMMFSDVVAFKK